jgi:hypothetical protein
MGRCDEPRHYGDEREDLSHGIAACDVEDITGVCRYDIEQCVDRPHRCGRYALKFGEAARTLTEKVAA